MLSSPSTEESPLVREYLPQISKKLNKLFSRWEKKNCVSSAAGQNELIHYFQENNQCKLPWTLGEVKSAINCLLKTLRI